MDSWKELLPELVRGYSVENIWNLDETGCSGVHYLSMVLGRRGLSVKEGKRLNNVLQFA